MFVTGMDISDFSSRFADVYDLDTGEKIKCIWANDSIGEYCEYVRDGKGLVPAKELDKGFVPVKRIRYGNIKIIDIRKERFDNGKVVTMSEEESRETTERLLREEKELLDEAIKNGSFANEEVHVEYTKEG